MEILPKKIENTTEGEGIRIYSLIARVFFS